MNLATRKVERLIGWLTFAIGITSLQANSSITYYVMETTGPIQLWIALYCLPGLAMVWLTYTDHQNARLVLLVLLLLLWVITLLLVAMTGPLGPVGGYGVVVVCYLIALIVSYMRVRHKAGNGDA